MRILVTGANGQVGRSILDLNGQDGHEIIGLTRQQFDLTKPEDFDRIVDRIEPDAIVNAAAYTMVDKAEDEPELAHQINAVAPDVMASVARKIVSDSFIFQLTMYSTEKKASLTSRQTTLIHLMNMGNQNYLEKKISKITILAPLF